MKKKNNYKEKYMETHKYVSYVLSHKLLKLSKLFESFNIHKGKTL